MQPEVRGLVGGRLRRLQGLRALTVADDLYTRYQAAHTAHLAHRDTCTSCTDTSRCPTGQRLYQSFADLQDAYLNRQRAQRR
ncbi:hypothetical protein [Rhodococcus qingshengii]|uniref:hypothetical protein n=1 Tax=Rhodococcus qingshengii TaxID=334542 RepID=UPI0036FEDD50